MALSNFAKSIIDIALLDLKTKDFYFNSIHIHINKKLPQTGVVVPVSR
jgi:hypothetical protein